ncbi:MAG: dipicolinate synthase subunit [Clostridia bacterium]|nr:dipicolinate synthase subunit [Clostridia bacterium]
MAENLAGKKVSIIGGDVRELYVASELLNKGVNIVLYGFEAIKSVNDPISVHKYLGCNIFADINTSDAIILPMPGVNVTGKVMAPYSKEPIIFDEKLCKTIKTGIPIFVGVENSYLKKLQSKFEWYVVPIADLDHVAVYNSIPTAEGALEIAMKELPITIHGSNSLVLGFGRVGITMARVLRSLGSNTMVAARDPAQISRAFEMGCNTVHLENLKSIVSECDMIFNTIPAMVLNGEVLSRMSKKTLIVDLASSPGGTDFEEAERLGIKAILAPGLPGKVAPETAGKILGKVYPKLLSDHLVKDGGVNSES